MTEQTRLSTKGQIVIPKKIRDTLGIKPGSRLFISVESGNIVIKKTEKTVWDFVGFAGRALSPTDEEHLAAAGLSRHVLHGDD